jgi:hypothetical protein
MQFLPTSMTRGAKRASIGLCLLALGAHASFAQTLGTAPDWVNNIPVGTWQAVSLNKLQDVDPAKDPDVNPNYPNSPPWNGASGQRAVISAWSGAAFATKLGSKGSYMAFGGGHNDYYGSEVYAFDMSTRRWARISDPYGGSINWPYSTASYPDGSAIPPHTYDFLEYHPGTNSFIVLKGQTELGPPSNETAVAISHMLDLGTGNWRRSPQDSGVSIFSGGYSVYDSKRDVFWVEGGSGSTNFVKFDPKTQNSDGTFGSWTNYPMMYTATDSVAAYDPVHDLFVVTGFRNGTNIWAVDLANPTMDRIALKEGGTPPTKQSANGWEWSPARQAFLYFRDGNGVYEFKQSGTDWKTATWNWRNLTSSSNSVTPEAPTNGVYSRFRVASYSDAEVALVVNSVSGSVYAFRVPKGISPNPPTNVTAN